MNEVLHSIHLTQAFIYIYFNLRGVDRTENRIPSSCFLFRAQKPARTNRCMVYRRPRNFQRVTRSSPRVSYQLWDARKKQQHIFTGFVCAHTLVNLSVVLMVTLAIPTRELPGHTGSLSQLRMGVWARIRKTCHDRYLGKWLRRQVVLYVTWRNASMLGIASC